jgi:hypothetical protein
MTGLTGCGSDSPTQVEPVKPAAPAARFIERVEVVYHSYQDHNPTASGDWIAFHVKLVRPDGTTVGCSLQVTVIRPYGTDCPGVGGTIDRIGPSTFRTYLYNVWVNDGAEDAYHRITVSEPVDNYGKPGSLHTGNNLTIAGAYDESVRIAATCDNCVYGQSQERLFRIKP